MRTCERGFTLIELIAVIVVLSIMATFSVRFVVSTIDNYNRTVDRGKLVAHGRQALERMTRQLRTAVPNSVRVTNANQCVEFLPIAGGGNYIGELADANNGAAAQASISTGGYQVTFGSALYAFVAALSTTEIYSGSAASVAISAAEDHSDSTLSLAAAHQFLRNSISHRFFLADNPVAFCVAANELRYYSGYATPTTTTGVPAGVGSLMAQGVASDGSPFTLSAGAETRNSLLAVRLTFTRHSETVALNQEVLIRNVP